jgi:hypothetical protein
MADSSRGAWEKRKRIERGNGLKESGEKRRGGWEKDKSKRERQRTDSERHTREENPD